MIRRGFAMPMVVMLALVVGLMGAVLLERVSAVVRLADREVTGYRDRHMERGLREVIGQWSISLAGQPIEKMTDSDGHVMDLELPEGGGAAIYMFDGQGGFLSDPRGLSAKERDDWNGVMALLQKVGAGDSSWWRPVGPLAVSAMTAPQEILEAIGNYAGEGSRTAGKRFAAEIVRARTQGDLTAADLATAINAGEFTPPQRDTINRLVIARGDLKAVVADLYEVTGGRRAELTRRYGGRMLTPGAGKVALSMQSMGQFLSWEELPLHD